MVGMMMNLWGFAKDGRQGGFTVMELIVAMAVMGLLAGIGLSAYGSYRERTWKVEATTAWHELSMAVNIYRMDEGDWPERYTHARHLKFAMPLEGPLLHNLAPANFDDPVRRAEEDMVGRAGSGGPTSANPTGHLVLDDGKVCVWVQGLAAEWNDASCP